MNHCLIFRVTVAVKRDIARAIIIRQFKPVSMTRLIISAAAYLQLGNIFRRVVVNFHMQNSS
jgi:hypothetical protein